MIYKAPTSIKNQGAKMLPIAQCKHSYHLYRWVSSRIFCCTAVISLDRLTWSFGATGKNTSETEDDSTLILLYHLYSSNTCQIGRLAYSNLCLKSQMEAKKLHMHALLSRRSRQRERLHATGVSVCLSVCLSPNCKNAIFSKTKQFRAMMSIDN